DVEDRHDGPQHHDTGDLQNRGINVVRVVGLGRWLAQRDPPWAQRSPRREPTREPGPDTSTFLNIPNVSAQLRTVRSGGGEWPLAGFGQLVWRVAVGGA